jgi:hypothetical protein
MEAPAAPQNELKQSAIRKLPPSRTSSQLHKRLPVKYMLAKLFLLCSAVLSRDYLPPRTRRGGIRAEQREMPRRPQGSLLDLARR